MILTLLYTLGKNNSYVYEISIRLLFIGSFELADGRLSLSRISLTTPLTSLLRMITIGSRMKMSRNRLPSRTEVMV